MVRVVAAVFGIAFAVLLAFAGWLIATPDYDGGRRGFGFMLLLFCGVAAVVIGGALLGSKSTRSGPRT